MSGETDSTTIFRRVIDPGDGSMSPDLARFVLELDFPAPDHVRYEELYAKAQDETLTQDEARELDSYLHVDSLIAIMRLKAERSLAPLSDSHGRSLMSEGTGTKKEVRNKRQRLNP
jgi:hypothetical protein